MRELEGNEHERVKAVESGEVERIKRSLEEKLRAEHARVQVP